MSGNASSGAGCGPMGCGMDTGGGAGASSAGASTSSGGGSAMSTGGDAGMGAGGGAGMGPAGAAGMDAGGASTGGMGGGAGMSSAGMGGFMVTDEMTEDEDMATEMMSGNEFIFDVQTHTSTDIEEPWPDGPADERALEYITQIFVMSETDVAVLSGAPNTRALGAPNIASRDQMKEIIDMLAGSPRLLIHGNLELERGASELDYMNELAEAYNPAAWKMYPFEGDQLLDSDEYAPAFVERALSLGIPMVANHRGLWDNGGYTANGSPADVVRAAAGAPEMNFLIYHSGYERMTDENHPYDPNASDHFGVDRLIRALEENGIGPDGNVYAELGTTWVNVMNDPGQAGHFLGKLLLALGPERILFGTDCLYNGNPQSQITAFRMFQISDQLQQDYGYPAITQQMREQMFGLNAARIYGVDPAATRAEISADDVTALRMAWLDDPNSVPTPDRRRFEGPRTRRQWLQMLKRDRFYRYG